MKKVSLAQFVAGLAMTVIELVISFAMSAIWPAIKVEYANSLMFRSWSDPAMMFYFLYPFILAVMLARIWHWALPLNPNWQKFGFLGFLTLTVPGMLITYASFQISATMVISWTITGFLQLFFASWLFAKIIK